MSRHEEGVRDLAIWDVLIAYVGFGPLFSLQFEGVRTLSEGFRTLCLGFAVDTVCIYGQQKVEHGTVFMTSRIMREIREHAI